MSHRVLVLCIHLQRHLDRYRERLARHGVQVDAPPVVQGLREPELLDIIEGYDGVIAGDDEITERVLNAASRLRIVVKWGIGMDAIDLAAAKRAGIPVVNTPGVFADEVADVALGYLLGLARGLHVMDRSVRQGGWTKVQGLSLRGRRAGVVGLGSIGRAVVERCRAFGLRVTGYDPASLPDDFVHRNQLELADLPQLLETSDFVILCCPLNDATRHLIDRSALERMQPGGFLINVARGPVVDEAALISALGCGRLAGAALDVFEEEPLPADSPLRAFEQCIFGTHNASNTLEAVLRTNELALEKLLRGLELTV